VKKNNVKSVITQKRFGRLLFYSPLFYLQVITSVEFCHLVVEYKTLPRNK